ncbi:NAD(P)/FAD-dependent oxidoreductase [Mycolicibacterium cosmeticum]|uniref:flavin-containing monooxygenase n=1 Tax=Mycolicibacterium cosmeticum TaxID=258533 RepID=UPI003204B18A
MADPDVHTLIVGAGFSGIGAAIKLDQAGLSDHLIVEAGEQAGGTWYWNTYPGIAVDIPSFSYQFSFEQSPDWSRTYAHGHELKAYADHCVAKYGIGPRIRYGTEVTGAVFDDTEDVWRVETSTGSVTARHLINAAGVLNVPKLPDIDGVGDFAGTTLHTARWDHRVDLTGKRVAVIGTGASAVQLIPEIAPLVEQLTVFQRTPIWCFPKFDVPLPAPARWAMRLPGGSAVQRALSQAYVEVTFPLSAQYHGVVPLSKGAEALGRRYLRSEVPDPVLRDKLTPTYAVGCKRPAFHNTYLSTFSRDNVTLVTEPIAQIRPHGVATTDSVVHDADILVLATGFKVMDVDSGTFPVLGSGGRSLAEFWSTQRMQAYEGVSVPGFPNFFNVCGPYGYVGSSFFALIETQTHHIVRCLRRARSAGATRVEVRREANDRYFAEMMRKRHRQIFWQDSCSTANSYYFDSNGDVPLRPASTPEAYWRSRRFPLDDYEFGSERR